MKKKHRNQFISRLLAMCLAAVMMLSMGITASAALTANSTGDFTVSGFDTTTPAPTVTAYQIITVNIDNAAGQPEYPMYTWAGPVAKWLTDNNYSSYVDSELGTNAVANAFADNKVQAADMTKFLEELAAAIKANENGGFDALKPLNGNVTNGTASFTGMAMGEYLIVASGGVKIYQPTTVELVPAYDEDAQAWVLSNATATMKSNDPSITKTVDDPQVAIGDTVTYTITADVPDYPENATNTSFIVSDKIDAGLTFDGIHTIEVYSNVDKQNVVAKDDYDVTTRNIEGRTFQISFHDDFTTTTTADTLYITYTATVNANAFGTNVLGNDAYLKYNNDPYAATTHELTDDVDVYTYGITVDKVDKNGNPLAGAKFKVTKDETPLKFRVTGTDGIYIPDADVGADEVEVSAAGVLQLQGLDAGTYTLTETEAPDGYVLPNGSITIKIADEADNGPDGTIDRDPDGNVVASGGAEIYVAEGTQDDGVKITGTTISFNVVNKTAKEGLFNLPVTGGAGTVIFTMAGILLMGGAVALLVVVLRRKRS